jgi:putative FmdB family regulatory protein
MPLYEYRCTHCQHEFELQQPVGAAAPPCPRCGGRSRKVFSSVGLIFKGSGFHTTDYRKASPADAGASKPAAEAPAGKDSKAAAQSESPADAKPGSS